MTSAQKMKERADRGMLENIMSLIEAEADKGRHSVDLSDYEDLWLTEGIEEELQAKGFKVDRQEISWK